MTGKKCKEEIFSGYGMQLNRCDNAAKYGDFCGVHSPEKKAARAAKRGPTVWERECTARSKERDRVQALEKVLSEARKVRELIGTAGLDDAITEYDALKEAT